MKLIQEAAQAAPPVSVAGLSISGVPLQEWVYIVTIVYTDILIVKAIPGVYHAVARVIQHWRNKHGCK